MTFSEFQNRFEQELAKTQLSSTRFGLFLAQVEEKSGANFRFTHRQSGLLEDVFNDSAARQLAASKENPPPATDARGG